MTTRVDEVEPHYKPARILDSTCTVLFWLNVGLSIATLYSEDVAVASADRWIPIFFTLFVVVHFILEQMRSHYVLPDAEHIRRKQLLSDSLGVPLTAEKTTNYYNNAFPPSLSRLAASLLENSFFGKAITGEMALRERIKVFAYAAVWLIALLDRGTPLAITTILTQALFSGEIFSRWLRIEILRSRYARVYDCLHSHFLNRVGEHGPAARATILDAFAMYECAKAAASINQSPRIFQRLNESLTKKWERISEQLCLSEQAKPSAPVG